MNLEPQVVFGSVLVFSNKCSGAAENVFVVQVPGMSARVVHPDILAHSWKDAWVALDFVKRTAESC